VVKGGWGARLAGATPKERDSMPEFIGFTGQRLTMINAAHVKAVNCIDACLLDMGSKNFEIKFAKYFGSAANATGKKWGNADSSYVIGAVNAMQIATKAGTYKVKWGGFGTVNAEMKSFALENFKEYKDQQWGGSTYQGVVKALFQIVVETTEATFSAGGLFKKEKWAVVNPQPMTIYHGFFANDLWKLDDSCQVKSYLHELSHHVAGTIDVKLSDGSEAYGWQNAQRCIVEGTAAHNADNVGFFVASYG
jgi:hypothetical protein